MKLTKGQIFQKYDFLKNTLFSEINWMTLSNTTQTIYLTSHNKTNYAINDQGIQIYTDNHPVTEAFDIELNSLWKKINRLSPFEFIRSKLKTTQNLHIKCKKIIYATYSAHIFTIEKFDVSKIIPKPHQENTDKLMAKYIREHDTMKKNLEEFIRFIIGKLEEDENKTHLEWLISSDCDKNIRITGALDLSNQYKWDYIGRKSPFIIVRNKIKSENKYHISSKFIKKDFMANMNITTFCVSVDLLNKE